MDKVSAKDPSAGNSNFFENIGKAILVVAAAFSMIAWTGLRKVKFKSSEFILLAPTIILVIFALTFTDYAHLKILHWLMPKVFTVKVVLRLRELERIWYFLIFTGGFFYVALILIGLPTYLKRQRFQRSLDTIGLRNAQNETPKISAVIPLDESRTKLLTKAKGIGVDRFESKRADLESAFGQMVERISTTQDRKFIEMLLCKKELTKMLPYEEAVTRLRQPYSFVVGESMDGVIVQDIRELPHMLIAGSTGGGKSVFFRQVLVGLLESSPHLQMYLIDLKRGVEVKEFGLLPNVRIAKDEDEAVQVLKHIKEEMHRRFVFMEEKGIKKIEPELHKKDLIVVAIDEASVLYGKTSVSKTKSNLVAQARDLTDEIAKLARAASIHLIIATQKAIKESLDTKTLENLPGRMAFKMSTHAGSNTALGNVKAYSLPDIKGRGIWAGGNKFIEVQAPFLSESDLEEKCKILASEFVGNGNRNFQPMIEIDAGKDKETTDFNQSEIREPVA